MQGDVNVFQDIVDEAKEMHKNEIIEAYLDGRSDQQSKKSRFYNKTSIQYYNEKYKSNEN